MITMLRNATSIAPRTLSMTTAVTPQASGDTVQIGSAEEKPAGKPLGQALWTAAKWGAVGGVLSAIPFVGYFASAMGGAIAGDLIAGKSHRATAMLMGGTAGLATHVIPMAGLHVLGLAFVPATVLF